MALNGFRVLMFVQTAPEVFAEIKRAIYTLRFAQSISDLSFHTTPFKMVFTMTWLPHLLFFK